MTSTSHAITSIKTSAKHTTSHLTADSFNTLFTISPAVLPNKSAAAMRLQLGENEVADEPPLLKNREVRDQRWQMFALLSERSTVKEAIRTIP